MLKYIRFLLNNVKENEIPIRWEMDTNTYNYIYKCFKDIESFPQNKKLYNRFQKIDYHITTIKGLRLITTKKG